MLIPLGVVLCMFGIVGRRVSIPQILSIILLKYFYSISIRAISASKTVRFSLRNGPFRVLKRSVSQCQMASFANRLILNELQDC